MKTNIFEQMKDKKFYGRMAPEPFEALWKDFELFDGITPAEFKSAWENASIKEYYASGKTLITGLFNRNYDVTSQESLLPPNDNAVLHFDSDSFTPENIVTIAKALKQRPEITKIQFIGGSIVADEGAKALANLETIKILEIANGGVGDEGAKALAQNKSLRSLILVNNNNKHWGKTPNQIGDEGAIALAVRGNFDNLDLSNMCYEDNDPKMRNHISEKGIAALNAAKESGFIKRLDISEQMQPTKWQSYLKDRESGNVAEPKGFNRAEGK